MDWSPKQASFLAHNDAFINIAEGAIRSGKTHSAMAAFAEMCLTGPPGEFAVVGKTERTVKRNVILPLKRLLPGAVRYSQGSGELYVFDRLCWVLGANDERAQDKAHGLTLAGSYCNEIPLYPESFWKMFEGRHSVDGAKILGDGNPEGPAHWLHKDYLTAGKSRDFLKRWRFKLYDNPTLFDENGEPKRYVKMLLEAYPDGTLWYKRLIQGLWVIAEGAIYQQWDEDVHVVDEMPGIPEKVIIGIDYGTSNATVFLALGLVRGVWYVFDEYYHSGRESGRQKTDGEYSRDLIDFIKRCGYTPQLIFIDPSAASFKAQLREDGVKRLRDADNSVVDGIRDVSTALTSNRLKVLRRCEKLREEFPGYVWDPKKQEKGEDYPLKEGVEDHALDATRYPCRYIFGRPTLQVVGKPVGA